MKFSEVAAQALIWLQREGRVSYRALKREFELDDDLLEDLKEELLFSHPEIADEAGRGMVWTGASPVQGSTFQVQSPPHPLIPNPQPPSAYTPSHLAERIRAVTVTDGERKTITALFADLKGSTALIEGLDPEEARAVIDPALQLMMDAVHQYDGFVAQALGDGIFALFGAPLAHEDHPQRALYAALRMQEAMRRYADTLRTKGYPPVLMRVGINTGEVVLRSIRKDDLHADYVPVGHSTNLAARMEQLATPGSILITEYTRKLVEGYFELNALGAATIKGVEAPLPIYEVLGAGPLRTRLQVAARRGLTRFVGRQAEMGQLQRALEQAKAGHGQIVGTMGEPGLGKSRLFYEFKLLSLSGCLVLEAYSVSHGKATAYLPVIELLKSYFDIQAQDDERKRREKVGGKVLMLDRSLEDTLPYLFALLGIEEQQSPLAQMDAQIRRRRTFEALKKLFLRESLKQPLILIFEDLHWIDSETQGFLDVLSESVASAKLLLLTNYRPEYRHEWGQKTYYTQLRLAPLGTAEAEEFLDELLGDHSSPPPSPQRGEGESSLPVGERDGVRGMENNLSALKQLILDKTQGTPFFMEEIVQELVEQGVLIRTEVGAALRGRPPEGTHIGVPLQGLHLPPTVQGILAARIDRLAPEEKALLQQLAIIGREFPLNLVKKVVTQPEEELYRLLASLQRKEFLYEQPAFPEVEYIFKHALTQEVAYSSVLLERRKALHERTAQAIENLYSANLDEHYSELAHHYSRSENTQKAIEYLQLAGQQAVQRSAYVEAIHHLTAALELLKTLPDMSERARRELTLQLALGPPLGATKGWAAPEVERVYSRVQKLCQQLGENSQLLWASMGLWAYHWIRGETQEARGIAEQLLQLAQSEQSPSFFVAAHYVTGWSLFYVGEVSPARTHMDHVAALYNPEQHHSYALFYGVDIGATSRQCRALALWCLGYPDQALEEVRDSFALVQKLSHPFTTAVTLDWAAMLHQLRGERQLTQERAEAAISLSTEQELPLYLGAGIILRGWALATQGEEELGISEIRRGLEVWHTTGTRNTQTHFLALLAEAYGIAGQAGAGLEALAEALDFVGRTGECFYEAELYRLKGVLLLAQEGKNQKAKGKGQKSKIPNPEHPTSSTQVEAEACFLRAIEVARQQQAKSWELRATMSLARLWQSQGKTAEARQMLAEIYGWFTEGFDTKDLQEAKALIEELSH